MPNPPSIPTPSRTAPRAQTLGLLASVALLTVLTGCPRPTPDAKAARQTQKAASTALAPGIWAVDAGEKLSEPQLWERLAEARFVVVGESHGRPWHHRIQRKTYEAMAARLDAPVALGMEMFQRPFQSALDAYVAGEIDEATMLERTEWESRWGMGLESYRKLWRAAHERGAPVVALNAPRELSRRVAEVGLDGLTDEERSQLPDAIDTSNQRHRQLVRRAFSAHAHGAQHGGQGDDGESGGNTGMSEETFERFYQAQVVWDETMAATAVQFLEARPDIGAMVIICGRFHAYRGVAIPPRIERRLTRPDGVDTSEEKGGSDPVVTLLPVTPKTREASMDLEALREADLADYVWVRE